MGRAHGRKQSTQELQQPEADEDQENTSQPKTTICQKWLWGLCELNAADCEFAHGIRSLSTSTQHKTTYCKAYFSKGGYCRLGDKCRFAHNSSELNCSQPKQKRAPSNRRVPKTKDCGNRNKVPDRPEEPRQVVRQDGRHGTSQKLLMPSCNQSLDAFGKAIWNAYHASVAQGLGFDSFKQHLCDELHIQPIEFHSYQEHVNACLESLHLNMPEPELSSGPARPWPHRVGRRHSEPAAFEIQGEGSEESADGAPDSEENASKAVICKDWLWGKCELDAASCPFAHGIYALTTASKFKKTSYCKAFFSKAGHCRNGARCHFAHSSDDLHTNAKAIRSSKGRRHSDPSILSHTSICASLPENMQSHIGVQASSKKSLSKNTHLNLHDVVSNALQSSIRGGGGLQSFWAQLAILLQMDADELQVHRYEIGECLNDISMKASLSSNVEKENTNMLNHSQDVLNVMDKKSDACDLGPQDANKRGGTLTDAKQCTTDSALAPGAQHDKIEHHGNACRVGSYRRTYNSNKVFQVLPCLLETDEEHAHLSEFGYIGA